MKFVVFNLKTNIVGCDDTQCFALNSDCYNEDGSINHAYLNDYGYEIARDNADMYGILGLDFEDCFWEEHEIVEFDSVEEAEEEYGEINNF